MNFLTCEPKDLQDPAAALRYAKKSVEGSGEADSDNLDVLARAYFQNGDRAQAIASEEKALSLLPPPRGGEVSPTRRRLEAELAKFRGARQPRASYE